MSSPIDGILGANDFICNCARIRRDDRDINRRRIRFICREIDEVGIDGIRRRRFICTELGNIGFSETDDLFF